MEPPRPRLGAFDLAVHLGHQGPGRDAARERVAVLAIGRHHGVGGRERLHDADRVRLLADIKMKEAADLRGRIELDAAFLEAADAQHLAHEMQEMIAIETDFLSVVGHELGDFVSNYYPSWVGRQVIKGLRRDVFSHYLRLPTPYLDRAQSGHLLSKLTNNIELVASAATSAAISLIGDSLTIIGLLITLFYMNWRLAAFCIAVAPVIAWLMQVANRSFRRYSERIQNSMGDITRVAKEAIDAHRLIKIFNAEDHQIEQIRTSQ